MSNVKIALYDKEIGLFGIKVDKYGDCCYNCVKELIIIMKLGVMIQLRGDLEEKFRETKEMGFSYAQLSNWEDSAETDENAALVLSLCEKYGITLSTYWRGWEGPKVWNFLEGPATLGLVPPAYRAVRLQNLKNGSDFAKKIGVDMVATHVGFLPENPNTTEYRDLIPTLRDIALYCKNNGQKFLFETGQETPITLKRTIEDMNTGNAGINLDTANLILYGKANPVDALDVFGEYVFNLHAKDGTYPTSGNELGNETPLGEGAVDFPKFIAKLKALGYDGHITIEREISGEQQKKDIVASKAYLETLF